MKLNYLLVIILIMLSVLVYPAQIIAHPHVFIDNSIIIVFDKKGLAGIKVNWVFDLMFSNMMINDFDKDKNNKFSKAEIKALKEESFSNLKEFNYFTYIFINKKEFKVKYAKDFSAKIKNKQIIFTFFIPCHVKANSSPKEIKIAMFDKTIYTDFALLKKEPVKFQNTHFFDYNYKILDNRENFYFGSKYFPLEIILKFKEKK